MKYLLIALSLVIGASSAQADDDSPNLGEAHIVLQNAEYVRVELNGTPWENIEFEKMGKLLLVKGLDTTLDHNTLVLQPREDHLKSFELLVPAKSFKRVRRGRLLHLVAKHTVKFAAQSAEPSPEKPAPAPPPVAPPRDDEDDL